MSDLIQWLNENLDNLDISGNRVVALRELKTKVYQMREAKIDALEELSKCSNLNKLYNCLNTDNEEAVVATEVICMMLETTDSRTALKACAVTIQKGLQHPSDEIKHNFLQLLLKYAAIENLVILLAEFPELLSHVINCLSSGNRRTAEYSVQFFKKIGSTTDGIKILFSDLFINILKSTMSINDITRFRIYEIVVDSCIKHDEALLASHESGILPSLLDELKSTDALLQLNALEILTNLTANRNGMLYLQREGVITFLVDLIVNIKNEPMSRILQPGLIEFFGELFKLQPAVFSQQHPEVFNLLFDNFDTVDPTLLVVLIATVGKIGSSEEGKRTLLEHDISSMFNKFSEQLEKKDIKGLNTMNTLTALMQTEDKELGENVCQKWFHALGPNALSKIVFNAKLPYSDLRGAGLELLGAISGHFWGMELICRAPGLLEFLMDRDVERLTDCKVAKHRIVVSLASHPLIGKVVGSDVIIKLKQHVNEGPFYVSAELLTSIE